MTGSNNVAMPLHTIGTLSTSASSISGGDPARICEPEGTQPHAAQAQAGHRQANRQTNRIRYRPGQPLVVKL